MFQKFSSESKQQLKEGWKLEDVIGNLDNNKKSNTGLTRPIKDSQIINEETMETNDLTQTQNQRRLSKRRNNSQDE